MVWAGAAVIVLADGGRGLSLGLALIAGGFAVLSWTGGEWIGGSALLVGGTVAAAQRFRAGPGDWGFMPPGSTPRLILSVVAGLLALWIAASVTFGPGAPSRFAALVVLGMMGGRILEAGAAAVALTAASALALAVGVASTMAPEGLGTIPYVVAALVAMGISSLPLARSRERP